MLLGANNVTHNKDNLHCKDVLIDAIISVRMVAIIVNDSTVYTTNSNDDISIV